MFELTEIVAALQSQETPQAIEAIVPTVVLPFVLISAMIGSLITAIAGWFGYRVHVEGPKHLLQILLRPRVLVGAIVLNLLIVGGVYTYRWASEHARPLVWIQFQNRSVPPADVNWRYENNSVVQSRLSPQQKQSPIRSAALGDKLKVQIEWSQNVKSGSFRGVSLSGNSAFVGTDSGLLFELDRNTGDVRRRFYIGKPVTPLAVVYNQKLFIGEGEHLTHHARVYAFDLISGKLIGAIPTKGHTEGDLVVAEHEGEALLFAAAGHDGVYAIDPKTVQVRWHSPITHFDSGVTVSGSRVFAATGIEKGATGLTPTLRSLDFKTGRILWETDLAASGWSRPIIIGDAVCIGMGEIYLSDRYGQFACFDQNTGDARLAMNFRTPLFNTPLIVSGGATSEAQVLVAGLDGNVCLLDIRENGRSGSISWCRQASTTKALYASAAIDSKGRLLVPSKDGLTVLDAISGRELLTWRPGPNDDRWEPFWAGASVGEDGWFLVDRKGQVRKLSTIKPSNSGETLSLNR